MIATVVYEAVNMLGREMLPAIKVSTMLAMLAVVWGTLDAAVRGTLAPHFMAIVFAPVALIIVITIYYSLKMRAA